MIGKSPFQFLLCLGLALAGSGTSVAAETNGAKLRKTALIEKYLEFAFGNGGRLTKFPRAPNFEVVCNTPSCRATLESAENLFGISDRLAAHEQLPEKLGDADITIVFADSISGPLKMDLIRGGEAQLEKWGGQECHVVRLRRDYTILGAVIIVGTSTVPNANMSCLSIEIARISGGHIDEQYDSYSVQLAKFSDHNYQIFSTGISYFTKVQWNAALHPGDDMESVGGALDGLIN